MVFMDGWCVHLPEQAERVAMNAKPIYTKPLLRPRGGQLPYSAWREQEQQHEPSAAGDGAAASCVLRSARLCV